MGARWSTFHNWGIWITIHCIVIIVCLHIITYIHLFLHNNGIKGCVTYSRMCTPVILSKVAENNECVRAANWLAMKLKWPAQFIGHHCGSYYNLFLKITNPAWKNNPHVWCNDTNSLRSVGNYCLTTCYKNTFKRWKLLHYNLGYDLSLHWAYLYSVSVSYTYRLALTFIHSNDVIGYYHRSRLPYFKGQNIFRCCWTTIGPIETWQRICVLVTGFVRHWY